MGVAARLEAAISARSVASAASAMRSISALEKGRSGLGISAWRTGTPPQVSTSTAKVVELCQGGY
eukprot:1191215-Prorocentrum_minimum.AAC.2